MDPAGRPLTEQQLRFCEEYAAVPNATRAYRRAFPGCRSYSSARNEGSKLLRNPAVAAEVEAARKEYRRGTGVSARRVLAELAAVAFADPIDLFEAGPGGLPAPRPMHDVDPAARHAVAKVRVNRRRQVGPDGREWEVEEVEYKFASKLVALDKLARHLGLTTDGAALDALLKSPAGGNPDPARPAS